MLENAFANGVPAKWITGDEVYGNNGDLRNWLESEYRAYVFAVACDTYIWSGFEQLRVDALVKTLKEKDWKRLIAREGSKGDRWYDWAVIEINSMLTSQWKRCMLFRRNIEDPSDIAYYLVFEPVKTTFEEMVHIAGSRWAIEICFESAKNEVGLDQYEVRKWQSWYYYITLAMFAHAFLTIMCAQENDFCAKKGDTVVQHDEIQGKTRNLIPLTVPEVRHLLYELVLRSSFGDNYIIKWSYWRRKHQSLSKSCHYRKRTSLQL